MLEPAKAAPENTTVSSAPSAPSKKTTPKTRKRIKTLQFLLVGALGLSVGGAAATATVMLRPAPASQIIQMPRTPKTCFAALASAEKLVQISAKSIALASDGLDAMVSNDTVALQQAVTALGQLTGPLSNETQNYAATSQLCKGTNVEGTNAGN